MYFLPIRDISHIAIEVINRDIGNRVMFTQEYQEDTLCFPLSI